eukprot:gnl/MRDRNA2_/MRDRNA2_371659_c0_seq1.p1 gnl/MRDRNA2_/MRDRNA2_371659_c0~~gnl/MRDRNA2_/MRDRNA2_371659_c0_seq1.p1  ORF type:complete len:115 (-),score=18.98 gnl/MRDRNA2_/MRDRNA2_371659_c0_seq1:97-441(-)
MASHLPEGFHENVKRHVLQRTNLSINLKWAPAVLPLPYLSFVFFEAALPGRASAEEIIIYAQELTARWASEVTIGAQSPAALSYDEVAVQFFEWFDKMEAMLKIGSTGVQVPFM